jgi:hypothetical protein
VELAKEIAFNEVDQSNMVETLELHSDELTNKDD